MNPRNIILEKSLINSHCEGMDSLVIKDGPGMVRMFIARPEHQLWRNNPAVFDSVFSIGLHAHRCDITIMPVVGEVYNVVTTTKKDMVSLVPMRSFTYKSPILHGGHGSFEHLDENDIPIALIRERMTGPVFMPAHKIHSVYVAQGKPAAWFIWEGAENTTHRPVCYSNADLLQFDFSKLDQPMTLDRLRQDLEIIGVRNL